MGDISRHRDIFLFSKEAVPPALLQGARLTPSDLTYLEIGNYLTDVSQFRDPVTYIFAKQRIWRDFILPQTADKLAAARVLGTLAAAAGLAATVLKDRLSGLASDAAGYGGAAVAVAGGVLALVPTDTVAGIAGADDWIDAMFGTPLERTPGDPKRREEQHYGYVGQFFRSFIEGVTHLLFAQEVRERVKGDWGRIDPIQETRATEVFAEFFSQYWPHEHTDQPPYVWDASRRPEKPMYQPSRRQRTMQDPDIGVMSAVDVHYVQYLAEGLTELESEWRALRPADGEGRQRMLVRMGKLLHGVEDWYFHSNVVELLRLRGHNPRQGATESDEAFLRRFVAEVARTDPEFAAADATARLRLQRKLYRRLRLPAYERGTKTRSGGRLSTTKPSNPSLEHAYPAFPSQQDTAHTLLHALENLELKARTPSSSGGESAALPPWVWCVIDKLMQARGGDGQRLVQDKAAARGVGLPQLAAALAGSDPARQRAEAVVIDVLREWVPLVVTLLHESERQRLAADVSPEEWPPATDAPRPEREPGTGELDRQLQRHAAALEPRPTDGTFVESNYERAIRYMVDCGFVNDRGRAAMAKAFEIDRTSQKLLEGAPGAGGFLMRFAVELQQALDAGERAAERLNRDARSVFGQASDNGAFEEIVGSHSLMSKDTVASTPFFDETTVLATVASSSLLTIMLEQVSAPAADRRLAWTEPLHHFIRFPPANGGWERRAIDHYRGAGGKIPTYADLPELARLVESAKRPSLEPPAPRRQTKREELEERYLRLELELAQYRYP